MMGSTFAKTFPEIVDVIVPMFGTAQETRKAMDVNEIPLTVLRNGFVEEAYFTGNFTPLRMMNGDYAGIYNAVLEVTKQYISDRRRSTLNLIPRSSAPLTTASVWDYMVDVLRTNGYDFPFLLLYQLKEETQSGLNHQLVLRGSIGVNNQHPVAITEASIDDDIGLMSLLRQARMDVFTREIREGELANIAWAGHGEPSRYISAAPLRNAGKLYGYVITALNARRPISDDWNQFVLDLSNRLASTVASTVTIEEAAKRERRLQDQILESEKQIRYMAQHSDISMQQLSLDRKTIWANQHYQNVVGEQDSNESPLFEDLFIDEDVDKALAIWHQVVQGQKAHTTELRMRRIYTTPHGGTMPTTILLSAFPYMTGGEVRSVMACMTEVSRLKWAEAFQATVARDANEAKRLQSQFTDAISHEVRNPLSAMLQLADDIVASVTRWRKQSNSSPTNSYTTRTLDEIMDAAKTIILCANHQKRIVDDVLTLSKMNLADMTLRPSTTRLDEVISYSVKILEADILAGGIEVTTIQEPSIRALDLDQVKCDPLRITQVLINLLSNAIKFTKLEAHRSITIRYGGTFSEPRAVFPATITWASQTEDEASDHGIFAGTEWGGGEFVYLTFQIEDTGLGMDEEQMQRVFARFEQASPQTSIRYGGSGLGLFICRSLSQKQCGGIGVASRVGKGTTLAFYVGSRKADDEPTGPLRSPAIADNSNTSPLVDDLREKSDERTISLRTRSKPTDNKTVPKYHILLVEDNLINQRILHKQLTRAGCMVHVANHGVEALEFLRNTTHWRTQDKDGTDTSPTNSSLKPLDVILMDVNMPVMDGLTCTTEIRSLESTGMLTSHIEIIAVTANASHDQAELALSAGADTIQRKPFVVSELLDLIGQRLDKRTSHEF